MSIEIVQLTASFLKRGDPFPEDDLLDPHEYIAIEHETGIVYDVELDSDEEQTADTDLYLVCVDPFPGSAIEWGIGVYGLSDVFDTIGKEIRDLLKDAPVDEEDQSRLHLLIQTTDDHWEYELLGVLDTGDVPNNDLPSTTHYKLVPVEGQVQP